MSRTFPRAAGARPAKCVSWMMRVTGPEATEKFLPKGGEHSSAVLRRGKGVRRGNCWEKLCSEGFIFNALTANSQAARFQGFVPHAQSLWSWEESSTDAIAFARNRVLQRLRPAVSKRV